jgi:lipopolysaccharide export system protein LptA
MTIQLRLKSALIITLAMLLQTSLALNTDANQPYNITSHTALHDSNKNITIFTGQAKMVQGSTTITGDKSTVLHYKNSNNIHAIITNGKPAHYTTTPKIGQEQIHASAQVIEFYPDAHLAILIGNASVMQNNNTMTGQKIFYDTLSKKALTKSDKSRNQLLIQPQQQGQSK